MARPLRHRARLGRRPATLLAWLVVNLLGGLVVPTIRKMLAGQRTDEDPAAGLGSGTLYDTVSVIIAQAAVFAGFWWVTGVFWAYFALWALPAVTLGGGLNCFRTALEHVDASHPPNRDWSFRSNPIELFFVAPFQMNLHWEHHFLMTVPYYHVPRFREYLRSKNEFPEDVLVGSYAGRLRRVLADLR